jgi:hypothetical protein
LKASNLSDALTTLSLMYLVVSISSEMAVPFDFISVLDASLVRGKFRSTFRNPVIQHIELAGFLGFFRYIYWICR